MIPKKFTRYLLILWLVASPLFILCQDLPTTKTFTPSDTVRTVEILPGVRKLEYRKIDSVTEIQILAGNVRLRQGTSIFECDSCVITKRLNLFEAFGNVHINDADTANVYSDHLRYLTNRRIAYLDGNVKLTDGTGTLTTPTLEYDVNTKVGIYRNGGRLVNEETVLTSEEGCYYADLKDVYFKKKVRLKDPTYDLESDSLLYNTGTRSEEHTSELQSPCNLVCRLLLEKKNDPHLLRRPRPPTPACPPPCRADRRRPVLPGPDPARQPCAVRPLRAPHQPPGYTSPLPPP